MYNVLNFARKQKYLLQLSAFTYGDNYIPTRIDFAKERYGGPFTTEQVESVKTSLRILLLLLALGPCSDCCQHHGTYFHSLTFMQNIVTVEHRFTLPNCTAYGILTKVVETGGLTALLASISFPVYIWFVFSVYGKNNTQNIHSAGNRNCFSLLRVFSVLIIDVVGHLTCLLYTSDAADE